MLESLLKHRARIEDSVAIETDERAYRYSELEAMANGLSETLDKVHRVKAGDRVVALVKVPLNYVLLFFALRKLGATLVPVNPRAGDGFARYVIEDVKPSLVIDDYFGLGISFEGLSLRTGNYSYGFREDPEETAMILYTGGTTGAPKGAVIHEGSVLWNAVLTVLSWGFTKNDCGVVSLPFYHTGGWNILLMPLLLVGGRSVLPPSDRFDAEWVIKALSERRCTVYMGVPTMLDSISRSPLFESTDLSGVLFIDGGGPLPPEVAERFNSRGYRIFQGYGLTEAGPNNFYISPERYSKKPASVGKPMLFIDMKPADDGELLIKGPHVFKGYWNRPEENPFTQDGYLRTGDIFNVDNEGDFIFLDRKKDMIKTGGENVYSMEVEMALKRLPYIEDAVVFGVPDEHWGEMIVALAVRRQGTSAGEEDVRRDLRSYLPSFKIPKRVVFVKEIPRTQFGKVSKRELRERYLRNDLPLDAERS